MTLPELLVLGSLVGFSAAAALGFGSRGSSGVRGSFLLGAGAAAVSGVQAGLVLLGAAGPTTALGLPGTVSVVLTVIV